MVLNISLGFAEQIGEVARRAGRTIMDIYETDFDVDSKDDSSPVTEADREAEKLIVRAIREGITNEFAFVGEEDVSAGNVPVVGDRPFWLIDPLDGTKEFISRNGEFTVNIALIEAGIPVLGVVHLPTTDDTFVATRAGVFVQYGGDGKATQISCRKAPSEGMIAIASRSHGSEEVDTYLAGLPIGQRISAGSSLKFCRVAEGKADVYPRFGPTMEWDTAAGHALLMYAGGDVLTEDGAPLRYGKPEFRNPHFIARGPGVPDPS
ncbi:MAG: 3'(2'),5'-bisphosphate nucleotidase CysQ [Rhodospirillales bacterium]|jgi:3'(2'), 5'-bisphosphate nucleotidase